MMSFMAYEHGAPPNDCLILTFVFWLAEMGDGDF